MRAWPRRLMLLAVITASLVAAASFGGAPAVGTTLVAGSAAILAARTYREELARRTAEGEASSRRRRAGMMLRASARATTILGGSTFAFMIILQGYRRLADEVFAMSHYSAALEPVHMAIGTIIGAALALRVASALDRTLARDRPPGIRRWTALWPVALVGVLAVSWGAQEMRTRSSLCRAMSTYHAARRGEGTRRDRALHAWLARWYERAALRPWLPIHPDRIPTRFEGIDS